MFNQSFVTLEVRQHADHILVVTFNRPEVRNAINHAMMLELYQLWSTINLNPHALRCIILTGKDKAFCAGADLKERNHLDLKTWGAQHIALEQAMYAMMDCPVPIIAAVNGPAFGGGLELALASDFAYAAKTASFAQSETKLGLIPGAMGTQNLSRACGLRRAKELCFTAKTFTAEEALAWGIVNKVCEPEQLMTDVINVAEQIAENAPFAVQQTKKALNISHYSDIKTGYAFELEAYYAVLPTKDREEGIKAFNEKRKPQFSGKKE